MLAMMKEILDALLSAVYALMPLSPFTPFIQSLEEFPYIGIVNWFIPVEQIVKIGVAWCGAILLWYFYGIILRWIKAIE